MPRALITGITGQDGGYLADALLADGWQVHGLVMPGDPLLPELLGRAPRVLTHDGDLTDEAGVVALVGRLEPDQIYNRAGHRPGPRDFAGGRLAAAAAARTPGPGAAGLELGDLR
jgi:GDP-D-mannose dehydratase